MHDHSRAGYWSNAAVPNALSMATFLAALLQRHPAAPHQFDQGSLSAERPRRGRRAILWANLASTHNAPAPLRLEERVAS
jgi:hypothetical protein